MELNTKDAILRKYLLGHASDQEQEEVELRLMSGDDAYDLLEAAEDDLIDDMLSGRLQGRDLDRFNTHFLAAPERRRKLQFSRAFRRVVASVAEPMALQPHPPVTASAWDQFWDALRIRPALAYATFTLTIALLVGGTWSVFRVIELQRQLDSATDQLATVGQDRDDLKRQLDESHAATQTLDAQLRALEGSITTVKPGASLQVPAVSLVAGLTRSSSDITQVALTANTSGARFSLALLDDNFAAYRVSLMNADGREIWSLSKLSARTTPEGKAIVFTVPAMTLSDGDYSFSLSGLPDSGPPENIARYYFRTVLQ